MLFVVHRIDKAEGSKGRSLHREEHIAYLDNFTANILLAGPYFGGQAAGDRGSMFLVSFDTLDDAREFAENDPFTKAGLFETLEVWPWSKRMGTVSLPDIDKAISGDINNCFFM